METTNARRFAVLGLVALPLIVVAVVVVVLAWGHSAPQMTAADTQPGDVMALVVKGEGADCHSNTQAEKCQIPKGSTFTLSIEVKKSPGPYIAFQTFVRYSGAVTYKQAAGENKWPSSAMPVRAIGADSVAHGDMSGIVPPQPKSTFKGNIVNLEFNCVNGQAQFDLEPYGAGNRLGAGWKLSDKTVVPAAPATLAISCAAPPTNTPAVPKTLEAGCWTSKTDQTPVQCKARVGDPVHIGGTVDFGQDLEPKKDGIAGWQRIAIQVTWPAGLGEFEKNSEIFCPPGSNPVGKSTAPGTWIDRCESKQPLAEAAGPVPFVVTLNCSVVGNHFVNVVTSILREDGVWLDSNFVPVPVECNPAPTPTQTPNPEFEQKIIVNLTMIRVGNDPLIREDPWTESNVKAQFAHASQIWRKANINLRWASQPAFNDIDDPEKPPVGPGGDGDILDPKLGNPLDAEFQQLCQDARAVTKGKSYPVTFIQHFVDAAGDKSVVALGQTLWAKGKTAICSAISVQAHDAEVIEDKKGETLAHELGHAFCLQDDPDPNNLMGPHFLFSGGQKLTKDQMRTARDCASRLMLPWDVGGNKAVDVTDIFDVAAHFGDSIANLPVWTADEDYRRDMDWNGAITVADIFDVAARFGQTAKTDGG